MPKLAAGNLTLTRANRAKPQESVYYIWDAEIRGFGLRVNVTGAKVFVMKYRNPEGKQAWLTLNEFFGFKEHLDKATKDAAQAKAEESLEKAKAKLAECGQPNGFDLNYAYRNVGLGPKALASVTENLGRVGIKVHGTVASDPASYYSTFIGSPSNIVKMKLGLAGAGWGADFPTPYGFWQSIANSNAILPEGNSNYPSLKDATVDSSLEALTKETDPAKVAELGNTVDHAVMDAAVYLPFVLDKTFFYRNPRLTNIYLNGGVGNYYDYVNVGTSDGM